MTDDYQLRKELDEYKWILDELRKAFDLTGANGVIDLLRKYYDQSQIDEPLNKFNTDLDSLNTSLDGLIGDITEFNSALIDFDEDNTNLDTDLDKLKDNLIGFVNMIGVLDVDLTELSDSLSALDFQVNGDATHDGFADTVAELQSNIRGLQSDLTSFGQTLNELSAGDNKLALTLSTLSGYLSSFKGTLSEFQNQIIADKGQAVYDGLDQELIKLIGAITNANKDIETHQDLIDDVQDTIGEEATATTPATGMFATIETVNTTAENAQTKANAVDNTITNTVNPKINQIQNTDIPAVKNKIGFDQIPSNTNLNTIATNAQSTATNAKNKADNAYDLADDAQTKIGNVDVTTTGDLQSQMTNTNQVANTAQSTANTAKQTATTAQSTATNAKNTADGVATIVGNASDLTGGTLISNINNVISDIDDVKDDIGDVSQLTGTVVQGINSVKTIASDVQVDMYGSNKDPANPQTGSVKEIAQTAQSNATTAQNGVNTLNNTTIPNINTEINITQNAIDNLILPQNIDYTLIYVFRNTPDMHEFLLAQYDFNFPTDDVDYALNYQNGTWYKKQGSSFVSSAEPPTPYVFVSLWVNPSGNLSGWESGVVGFYNIQFKKYYTVYKNPSNTALGYYEEWQESSDIIDFSDKTKLFVAIDENYSQKEHTHSIANITNLQSTLNGKANSVHTHTKSNITDFTHTHITSDITDLTFQWETITLNQRCTLYINSTLKLCRLHYNNTFSSASADTFYTWHSGLIPEQYRPAEQAHGSLNQVGTLYVTNTGNVGGKFANGWNSSRLVYGDVWWNYG